jgi:hypothetical protein
MLEVLLDFILATDLLLMDDLRIVQTLEGENVIRLDLGADPVNTAKFAFAQKVPVADVKCR